MWDEDRTFQLTFFLRDDDGATGKVILYLPVALSAYARQFCLDLADLIRTVTNCALTKVRITMSAAAKTPNVPNGSAATYGVFVFATATPDERYVLGIPGINPSKVFTLGDGAGILIDPNDSDVAAYVVETLTSVVTPWNIALTSLTVAGMQLRPSALDHGFR